MKQYNHQNLVIHPGSSIDQDVIVGVTPSLAGWDTINFQVRCLAQGNQWSFSPGEAELALVILSGTLDIKADCGHWNGVGQRDNVFSGLPSALYLPPGTNFTVSAVKDCEFAIAWTNTDQVHPARLITPEDIKVEIRGGDHATRQINSILPPGFPCSRLVVVEVYTPGGNWSSYPGHKHDLQKVGADGKITEADLDEIYYYKIDRPQGFALQYIYTAPESPLHAAGYPIDAVVVARDNDVVIVPEGYHPVSCPPGYTSYYLNILAGSAQSLANTDDPQQAWIKNSFQSLDPRVPIYPVDK